MNAQTQIQPARASQKPTPAAILDILDWAFRRERVSIDFDQLGSASGRTLRRHGTEYRLLRQAELGCVIDGGGRSDPHPDAERVAEAVAALPEGCGGRAMGLWIAELARAGRIPDWMPEARPRFLPAATHQNQFGQRAATRDAVELGPYGWPPQRRRTRKGGVAYDRVMYTPLVLIDGSDKVAAARRAYLGWWGALRELRVTFQVYGGLTAFTVTDAMPPMRPWQKKD